jgi:hypothetical protein
MPTLWLFTMSESLPADQFTVMIVTHWAMWTARMKAIHEDICQTPFATDGFITAYLSEIMLLQSPPTRGQSAQVPRPNHSLPPPENHAEVNIDAAVARDEGFGTVSAVCHDLNSMFLGASAVVLRRIIDLRLQRISISRGFRLLQIAK